MIDLVHAGSSGSHRARMSSELLKRLIDDSALELLLIMAQHISHVSPYLHLYPGVPAYTCVCADLQSPEAPPLSADW